MEQTSRHGNKLKNFQNALDSFEKAMSIDISNLNEIEKDTIKSGQVKKFEICVELLWKTLKSFLLEKHGVEAVSPKISVKEVYNLKVVDEKEYEVLIEMINDRNRLSHIYNEMFFEEIYKKLVNYLNKMKTILNKINVT